MSNDLDTAFDRTISILKGDGLLKATAAAGNVVFKEIRLRAKGSIKDALSIRTYLLKSGDGARSSIQVQDSGPGGQEHHAVFLEYGTVKMAAQPFMRPGYDAAAEKAADAFANVLAEELRKI